MNCYREMFLKSISRNLEKNTIDAYDKDIKIFLQRIEEEKKCSEDNAISFVSPEYIENYINLSIKNKEYTRATINRQLASLTRFFNYIKDTLFLIEKNPFSNIERFHDNKSSIRDSLTLEESKALIKETYTNKSDRMFKFSSARTRFIVGIMATTGMRINEVLSLKDSYVESIKNGYMINIPKEISKNKRKRRVPISGKVINFYKEYLRERNKYFEKCDYLIISNTGKKFNDQNSRDSIKKYIDRIGIEKNIGNHSFRHTFRTVATKNNVNEGIICLIGGWSRKGLGNQSEIYLHDTKELDEIKQQVCNIL